MRNTEKQNKLIELVEKLLDNKITALTFHNQYLELWNTPVTEMDADFKHYKDGILASIFCCCDIYCEPENRAGGGEYYDDEQLKEAVKIYFESENADDGFEKIADAGLISCTH